RSAHKQCDCDRQGQLDARHHHHALVTVIIRATAATPPAEPLGRGGSQDNINSMPSRRNRRHRPRGARSSGSGSVGPSRAPFPRARLLGGITISLGSSRMKERPSAVSILIPVLALSAAAQERGVAQRGGTQAPPPMMMTITGFPDGGQIPVKFS